MITPFKKDYSLDLEGFKNIVDFQINEGADYLVILGTTGESVTLDKEEKEQVIQAAKDVNNGRLPIVVGVGGNNTRVLRDTIKSTDFSGIDGILSVSPYYNKPNQRGIYNHYATLAEVSPRPIILYNVPGRTGSNMQADTSLSLARDFDNITTLKEASGNFSQGMDLVADKPDSFTLVSGEDDLTLPLISLGFHGVISVTANAFPGDYSRMVAAAREGRHEEARSLQYKMLPYMRLFFSDGSPAGVKAFMSQKGLCENVVRPPLAPVKDEVYNKLLELSNGVKT